MQFAMALKIIGVLLILFSTTMLPSLFIGLVAGDGTDAAFATGFATTLFCGIMIWLSNHDMGSNCIS